MTDIEKLIKNTSLLITARDQLSWKHGFFSEMVDAKNEAIDDNLRKLHKLIPGHLEAQGEIIA